MKKHFYSLTCLFSFVAILQGAILPAEKLLPSDTLLFFSIPDYGKLRETTKDSPALQFWRDPSMKAFKDNFLKKFSADVVAPFEKELGIRFADYKGLAQGTIAFGLTQNNLEGKPDQRLGLIFLMDTRGKSSQLATNLSDLKKKWIEAGKEIKSEKIRGLNFTTLITTDEEIGKPWRKLFSTNATAQATPEAKPKKELKKMEITIGQVESLLLIGNSTAVIEKIVAHQTGGMVPALATQPVYEANHNVLFRDASFFGWVNVKSMLELMTKKPADSAKAETKNVPAIQPEQILAALGLNGLKSVAFTFNQLPEGTLIKYFIGAPETGRQGILKLLTPEAKEAKPPPFIPADATKFSRWRLNLPKAWSALESTLEQLSPAATGALKLIFDSAGKDQDPNFDLRKELIGNLGDDFITVQKSPRASTIADLKSPPTLYLIGSPNAEKLAKGVKAAMSSLGQPSSAFKERDFLGRKIYSLAAPSFGQPTPGKPPPARTLNFSGSGGYLAISTDVPMLEEYLRSSETKGQTLGETAGLSEAAEKVGGWGTGLFGFDNQAEAMRTTFDVLKKDQSNVAPVLGNSILGKKLGLTDNQKLKEWADFSLLPPYESIVKYFYYSVYAGRVGTDGFTAQIFGPTPPGAKK